MATRRQHHPSLRRLQGLAELVEMADCGILMRRPWVAQALAPVEIRRRHPRMAVAQAAVGGLVVAAARIQALRPAVAVAAAALHTLMSA